MNKTPVASYLEWCWYTAYDSDNPQILSEFPIAQKRTLKGLSMSHLESRYGDIRITTMCNRKIKESIIISTIHDLHEVKSQLINSGMRLNWLNFQLILSLLNEHFKVYSPYIKHS